MQPLASRGQLKESAKVLGGFHAHDEASQLLALVLADHIAAQRGEFYRDLFLDHRIAWIAFGHIDTRAVRLAVISRDRHAARLKLREQRFELFIRDNFYLVHDWNQRLIADAFFGSVPNEGGFGLALDNGGNLIRQRTVTTKLSTNLLPMGRAHRFRRPSAFGDSAPIDLTFDTAGNLFVSTEGDPGNDTILEFTPNGMESTFATGLTNPRGLAFLTFGLSFRG